MRAACDLWQPAVYSTFTSSSTAVLCCALSPLCCQALLSACPTSRTVSGGISTVPEVRWPVVTYPAHKSQISKH